MESGIHGPGSAGRGGDAPHSCAGTAATEEVFKPVLTQLLHGPHSDIASTSHMLMGSQGNLGSSRILCSITTPGQGSESQL